MKPAEIRSAAGAVDDRRLWDDWRAFALDFPGSSYFQSPDWFFSWWETMGGRCKSTIGVWRDGSGAIESLAVVSRQTERLHPKLPLPIRYAGNGGTGPGSADHAGWLVADRHRADVTKWAKKTAKRGRSLIIRNVTGDVPPVPRARVIEEVQCPLLDPIPPAEEVGSSKLRKQLRQYRRRMDAAGVTFEWTPPGQVEPSVLDGLFALHDSRHTLKDEASTFGGPNRALHLRLIERAGDRRGPAVVRAIQDGRLIGILYGLWWKDTFSYFQTGWEPEWQKLSLGTVLVAEAIDFARGHGATRFDFLRGPERYKYRFGAEDVIDRTWLRRRGFGGELLRLKYAVKARQVSD